VYREKRADTTESERSDESVKEQLDPPSQEYIAKECFSQIRQAVKNIKKLWPEYDIGEPNMIVIDGKEYYSKDFSKK
jgi:hypothetical protein